MSLLKQLMDIFFNIIIPSYKCTYIFSNYQKEIINQTKSHIKYTSYLEKVNKLSHTHKL